MSALKEVKSLLAKSALRSLLLITFSAIDLLYVCLLVIIFYSIDTAFTLARRMPDQKKLFKSY